MPKRATPAAPAAAPLGAALARLASQLGLSSAGRQPGPARVHRIRVTLKRLRALLRLAERQLGAAEFQRLDGLASALKREFAAARDDEVLRRLARDLFGRKTAAALPLLPPGAEHPAPPRLPRARRLAKQLAAAFRAGGFPEPSPARIDRAREESFRAAARLMRRCAASPEDDELFHEWRKQVKTLFYQHELPAGAVLSEAALRRLARLSRALGNHHDLSLLEARLAAAGRPSFPKPALALVRRKKAAARRRALRIGAEIFGAPAGAA